MAELAFALLGLAAVVAFLDWRRGLAVCVLTALIQDPLRKLVPGEPGYFILFVGVVFAAAWLGALMARVPLRPSDIHGWSRFVGTPYLVLMLLVLVHAMHSYGRWGAPIMTAMGLMFFLAPTLAIAFAYQFAVRKGSEGVTGWLRLYVVAASLALTGIYLEYSGIGWRTLGEVGVGLTIYDLTRGAMQLFSGFFRSSEVAAWHAASAGCFAFLLLVSRRHSMPRWLLALAAIALMIALGLLTGRRKMLVMMAIFLSAYLFFNLWFQRGQAKAAILAGMAGILAFVYLLGAPALESGGAEVEIEQMQVADDDLYSVYTKRGQSVFGAIPARFEELGVAPISWALDSFGFFGAGLGVATQGANQFAPASLPMASAGEGGLGKLTVELGIPGLLVSGWLLWAFTRYVWRILAVVSAASPTHAKLGYGLFAFLLANAATFTVATQVYGDVFILLFIGTATGCLLALPVIAGRELAADQGPATAQVPVRPGVGSHA